MDSKQTFLDCAQCEACGRPYQSIPPFAAGSMTAPIVVLAQNPGAIHDDDRFRLAMAETITAVVYAKWNISSDAIRAWYYADFVSSRGFAILSSIFGNGWLSLDSGMFLYSNAVRCRTKDNAMPPKTMMKACAVWTRMILDRPETRAVITIGALAAQQVFETPPKVGVPLRYESKGWAVLALPHYTRWAGIGPYEEAVKKIVEKVREK